VVTEVQYHVRGVPSVKVIITLR